MSYLVRMQTCLPLPKRLKFYKLCMWFSSFQRVNSSLDRFTSYGVTSVQRNYCSEISYVQWDAEIWFLAALWTLDSLFFYFAVIFSVLFFCIIFTNHADKWFTRQKLYICLLEKIKIASFSDNCITLCYRITLVMLVSKIAVTVTINKPVE